MRRGYCYGIAVGSQRMFLGNDKPSQYQSGATTASELSRINAADHIAWFFVQQDTSPAREEIIASLRRTVAENMQALHAALASDDMPVIAFLYQGKGHAVTAYRVQRQSDGSYRVYVYDSNRPQDAERYITINTQGGWWRYESTFSFGDMIGTNASHTLAVIPTSKHGNFKRPCPWPGCPTTLQATSGTLASASTPQTEFRVHGSASISVQDEAGRRIGYTGDTLVNEIADASVRPIFDGSGRQAPLVFSLPESRGYSGLVDGSTLTQTVPMSVVRFDAQRTVAVDDMPVTPGSNAVLTFIPHSAGVSVTPSATTSVTATMTADAETISTRMNIGDLTVQGGEVVSTTLDQDQQAFTVALSDRERRTIVGTAAVRSYHLDLLIRTALGEEQSLATSIDVAVGDTHAIDYGSWSRGEAEGLTLVIDHGSDGTIDERRVIVSNAGDSRIYIPMISG